MTGKEANKAGGHTRNKKPHAVVDGMGSPVAFLPSAGNERDFVQTIELLEKVKIKESSILADHTYGAHRIREHISEHDVSYVVSPQSNVSPIMDGRLVPV